MPTSQRMNWPYPKEYSEHWMQKFEAFVNALDASVFTTREDKNFVLFGGGLVSFDATTGVLTWAQPLQGVSAVTGMHWYIESNIAGGSITLQDGEFFYVEVTRAPTSAQNVTAKVGSRIPVSDNAIVLAQRLGTAVIFRNGAAVGSGQSVVLFGPSVLTQVASVVGLAGLEDTADTGWQDRGGLVFDPGQFFPGGAGITRTITFKAILWTTDDVTPLTARARLWNLTDGVVVSGSEVLSNSLTPEAVESPALVPGTGGFAMGEADYLVQLRLDDTYGAPTPADQIACLKGEIRVVWA